MGSTYPRETHPVTAGGSWVTATPPEPAGCRERRGKAPRRAEMAWWREVSPRPGAAMFGTGVAKSMYAALYGELAPYAPLDELSQDAYSLFYARSAAMGWLTPAVEGASGGSWGMNDAGAGPDSGPHPPRVAWFQVTLTGPPPGGFCRCSRSCRVRARSRQGWE